MNWQQSAIRHLQQDKVILMPTDTIWGLGGSALSETAYKKMRSIKNRPANKTMIGLVSDVQMLQTYVTHVPDELLKYLATVNQPTTVIYPSVQGLPEIVLAADKSFAFRIVTPSWLKQLIAAFGAPILSTSANVSGEESATTFSAISQTIKHKVDYIVPYLQTENKESQSSRIVALKNEKIHIIR